MFDSSVPPTTRCLLDETITRASQAGENSTPGAPRTVAQTLAASGVVRLPRLTRTCAVAVGWLEGCRAGWKAAPRSSEPLAAGRIEAPADLRTRVLSNFPPLEPNLGVATIDAMIPEGITVQELTVAVRSVQKVILDCVTLQIPDGQVTVVVGASGSGKTMFLKTLLGALPVQASITSGSIWFSFPAATQYASTSFGVVESFSNTGAIGAPDNWRFEWLRRMRSLWGTKLGYVGQHGRLSLDPTRPIGTTLEEAVWRGELARRAVETESGATLPLPRWTRLERRGKAIEWLERLRLVNPAQVLDLYPSQLSGGMAQRVLIATVLARGATLLVADEPTFGLDAANSARLIDLFRELREQEAFQTLLLVTHDLGLAQAIADQVAVMHEGKLVEVATAHVFFREAGPKHEQARALLCGFRALEKGLEWHPTGDWSALSAIVPRPSDPMEQNPQSSPADLPERARLTVQDLHFVYRGRRGVWSRAADRPVLSGLSLTVAAGEIVGVMGESGIGKTTMALCLTGQLQPARGRIVLDGIDLQALTSRERRRNWKLIQILYQSVDALLHPQMRVEDALQETARHLLQCTSSEANRRVSEVLEQVELLHRRYAFRHELSGGELRRVAVARILLVRPRLIIADEPTAGIDASLRAGMLDLLCGLCRGPDRASMVLISHDQPVLRHASDRILKVEGGCLWPALS